MSWTEVCLLQVLILHWFSWNLQANVSAKVLFCLVNVLACDKTCWILIVPKTDFSSLEGFMGPSCTFCNEPKQISSHLVFYTIGHQPLCNDMVDPNTQPKRKLSTYFLIFAENTNLKKTSWMERIPLKNRKTYQTLGPFWLRGLGSGGPSLRSESSCVLLEYLQDSKSIMENMAA